MLADPTIQDLEKRTQGRWLERHNLKKLDIPDDIRGMAEILISQLEAVDVEVVEADRKYEFQVRPYIEEEYAGRQFYRDMIRRRANEAKQRGERPDYSDMGF